MQEQSRRPGGPGNPAWQPGVSGNPGGKSRAARLARLDVIVSEWVAPRGGIGALSPAELAVLRQCAELSLRRPADDEKAVRAVNTIARVFCKLGLIDQLEVLQVKSVPPLRDRLAG